MDYDKLIAPAAEAMRPSGIRKFFDLAAEMPECISLGVGEPDFKTPWAVREAGIESLEHGRTRYTSNAGLKELRAEVCKYLERRMGLHYDPLHEVLITVGGSEAIDMCIRTLVQPGDEVIIPEPCFVCYEPITTLSGGVPVHVACRQEDEFRLRADALKAAITPKTKLLIMPFPNNPTGAVMEREDLEAVADVLRGTNIMVLSDEIYAELNYGLRPHVSIATLPGMAERTIVVNGFSKTYAMTGWRLGYACGPAPIIKIMTKIHQSAIMSAPTTSQYAAITALRDCDGEIDRMRDEYNMRRRLVVRTFNEMGLTCFEPRGAFYAFPCIKSTGMTSQEFCTKLLEQKHVALVPGDAFGASGFAGAFAAGAAVFGFSAGFSGAFCAGFAAGFSLTGFAVSADSAGFAAGASFFSAAGAAGAECAAGAPDFSAFAAALAAFFLFFSEAASAILKR